jgi:hypothetical protein
MHNKDRDKNPNWCANPQDLGEHFRWAFLKLIELTLRFRNLFIEWRACLYEETVNRFIPRLEYLRALRNILIIVIARYRARFDFRIVQRRSYVQRLHNISRASSSTSMRTCNTRICMHRGHNISHKISGTYPAQGNLAETLWIKSPLPFPFPPTWIHRTERNLACFLHLPRESQGHS